MTTATITPLPSGAATCELHGLVKGFPSWEAAADWALDHYALPKLLPFPGLSVDHRPRVKVLADITQSAASVLGAAR